MYNNYGKLSTVTLCNIVKYQGTTSVLNFLLSVVRSAFLSHLCVCVLVLLLKLLMCLGVTAQVCQIYDCRQLSVVERTMCKCLLTDTNCFCMVTKLGIIKVLCRSIVLSKNIIGCFWKNKIVCGCKITTITIYFIHPSGELKLSFDRTTKNIPQ